MTINQALQNLFVLTFVVAIQKDKRPNGLFFFHIWFLVIGWCNEGNINFEDGTKLKKPFIINPLLKRAMKQEMKMTTNLQLLTLATWTSATWDGKMVKNPISCPLIGLMYHDVSKASCLTFTVYMIRYSLISMTLIYYLDTWALIWYGIVPVFLKICNFP